MGIKDGVEDLIHEVLIDQIGQIAHYDGCHDPPKHFGSCKISFNRHHSLLSLSHRLTHMPVYLSVYQQSSANLLSVDLV